MLISIQHKFIFVAGLKIASTSIEKALRRRCEVAIGQTGFGKHDGLRIIQRKFGWLFNQMPLEEFFVFGVIRDPVDYFVSLYNSHQKDAFDGKPHSTKGMSFETFAERWIDEGSWQVRPQKERFVNADGELGVDCLLSYQKLEQEWPSLMARLGFSHELPLTNESPEVFSAADVAEDTRNMIARKYRKDYDLIATRPFPLEAVEAPAPEQQAP